MARNTDIVVAAGAWTELTNANVTNFSAQSKGRHAVFLKATTGSTPTDFTGAIYLPMKALLVNEALIDLWPGATSANRVFAYAENDGAVVMISHA